MQTRPEIQQGARDFAPPVRCSGLNCREVQPVIQRLLGRGAPLCALLRVDESDITGIADREI